MPRFVKKPVEVEAVQWTGNNADEVYTFAVRDGRTCFGVLDPEDAENSDDPEATAEVFDKLHSTWVLAYDGDWIIRGVKGEFYPCRPDVFEATYQRAGQTQEGDR